MDEKIIKMTMLTTSFPLKKGAVSGVFVQRLVKNLPSYIHITVIAPSGTESLSSNDDKRNYRLKCFRYAPWRWQILAHQPGGVPVALKRNKGTYFVLPFFLMAMFIACFREAKKSELIHANWSINGAIAGIVGRLTGKPVVTTLRGEDVTRAESSRLYLWFLNLCLKSNDQLITVSEAISISLKQNFPKYKDKVSFLPNGVEAELLNIARVPKDGSGVFRLVAVGSLIPRKGMSTIINALAQLKDRQHFHLSVIGSGAELSGLEALVQKESLLNYVEFVGEVVPEKVVDYLVKADAFVLASYSEGRPNVVLEALAVGVPVIASDIDGVRELIADGMTGLRFPAGSAKKLAQKIEQLAKDFELQERLARQGREFIVQNHLIWRDVGEQYAHIYQKIIDHRKGICAD